MYLAKRSGDPHVIAHPERGGENSAKRQKTMSTKRIVSRSHRLDTSMYQDIMVEGITDILMKPKFKENMADDVEMQKDELKEPGKQREVYSQLTKIIQLSRHTCESGSIDAGVFITEMLQDELTEFPGDRETGLLWSLSVFIRSSMIWERVHDFQLGIESYQQKVNLTAPTISFPGVEKHKMFSIIYEPVHGIIYKNSKKEKRVMRHSEIHKFCDATLNRVLEGLKSYNNDVKYGYVQRELTNDEVEYLKLFEEEIEVS
ncbi:hypothetical protein Tco_0947435 [Tanacetum coccineum]